MAVVGVTGPVAGGPSPSEEATLRSRPMPGLAAFAALVSLAAADISLVEILPVTYRLGAAVAAIPFLCLSIAMLRQRLMLRAFPGGVEVGRLGRRVRGLPWEKIGDAVVHTGPCGRRVVLWSGDRRRRVVELREQHVSGSLEAVVASGANPCGFAAQPRRLSRC